MAEIRSTIEKWNITDRGRAVGVELLRVLCLVWIIMGHCLWYGVSCMSVEYVSHKLVELGLSF